MTISDGKMKVESRSGPKSGVVRLSVADNKANLTLEGAGSDIATAKLSGAKLSNFRSIVNAILSDLSIDRTGMDDDSRMVSSGYQSLVRHDDGYAVTIEREALEQLGLVNEDGTLTGGGRQVRSSVLTSGTAIINLLTDEEAGFQF